MTGDTPAGFAAAFDRHGSLTHREDNWAVTTTVFDATVTADPDGRYTVTIRVPTLEAATTDEVGEAVAADWLRTFRRRLEDAPAATRRSVELDSQTVVTGERVRVSFEFACADPAGAAEIATTLAEFVEGTYVGGVVPGYAYDPPVADLLAAASHGDQSGAPL